MVHSAVKVQAYLLQSQRMVLFDEVVEQDQPSSYATRSPEGSALSPGGPKDVLRTSLRYLSDMELFNLIITRLSKAVPKRPPLYLTPLCIEGVHDFFHPNKPVTDSALLSGLESLDTAARNPFGRMPITRRDSVRLGGKFNISSSGKNSSALLTSLATLFSFLEPAELRNVIQKRIADAASYRPVECFREFLESGGDGVPSGKVQFTKKRALMRDHIKEKKKQKKVDAERQHGERSSLPPFAAKNYGDPDISDMPVHDDSVPATDATHSFSDLELEDGEILSRPDSLCCSPPRSLTHPFIPFSSGRGAAVPVPLADHIAGPGTAPPLKNKKRRTKAVRRANRESHLRKSIASPPVVGPPVPPEHFLSSTSMPPTSKRLATL